MVGEKSITMRHATAVPAAVGEPKRFGRLTEFLVRLVKEKPLGAFGGLIILIWILVG